MKNSFLIYYEYEEQLSILSDEELGQLIRAIFKYEKNNEIPKFNGVLQIAFLFIKGNLDRDREKYDKRCETSANNGKLGGRPPKEKPNSKPNKNLKKPKKADNDIDNVNDNDNDNEIDIVNDIDKDITLSETKVSTSDIAKANRTACKHKYGEYKHVLLKDEELQALKRDYSNWEELITYLDEYIEMKGTKYKSHYLAIRKWVVDAVNKKSKSKNNDIPDWVEDWVNGKD